MILRYDNTVQFYRCDPNWCPHSTPCTLDLKYRFLFCKSTIKEKNNKTPEITYQYCVEGMSANGGAIYI